ncbi:acylneuraminate cytidylyltransferase [Lysinibacillus sphaericus]|nr:glycosyltransferase family protein [Lysinibacillus sphaericus]KEK10105.1 acylneuraminate cytidylyltransferase [Lysinibacillus sphaericus]
MMIITIIQARVGSTRLPEKVLKPLGDKDVLSYVVDRCRKIEGVNEVIVATSTLTKDNAIANWCEQHQVAYFRGSEQNVLSRYVEAAESYQPDYIMRVTADCPFVDYELATDMVKAIKENPVDIVDIVKPLPRGLAVEIISYEALKRINNGKTEERHREHVTYYAYEYKYHFTRLSYEPNKMIQEPQLRITLDTKEDYELCQAVAQQFNDHYVSSAEVVKFLKDNPKIAKINGHIEQKPVV